MYRSQSCDDIVVLSLWSSFCAISHFILCVDDNACRTLEMSEVHSESRSIVQVILIWVFALFWSAVTCVRLAIEWFKHRDTFFEVKEHLKPNVLDGWTHESAQLSVSVVPTHLTLVLRFRFLVFFLC